MKKIWSKILIVLLVPTVSAYAEEVASTKAESETGYVFPVIKPEIGITKGYRCTASYAYFHNKIQQDIAIGGVPVDFNDPYKNMAQSYAFDLAYTPAVNLSIMGGMSYTIGSGGFYPIDQSLLTHDDLSSFSILKTRETTILANAEYRFKGGLSAGLQYRLDDFKDVLATPMMISRMAEHISSCSQFLKNGKG